MQGGGALTRPSVSVSSTLSMVMWSSRRRARASRVESAGPSAVGEDGARPVSSALTTSRIFATSRSSVEETSPEHSLIETYIRAVRPCISFTSVTPASSDRSLHTESITSLRGTLGSAQRRCSSAGF
jgi:hypothetical protein